MLYHVQHVTEYLYQDPVSLCHNLVHLKPRWTPNQVCHRDHLHVEPEPNLIEPMLDYFGNPTAHFTIQDPHKILKVTASLVVEVHARATGSLNMSPPWETVRDELERPSSRRYYEATQYTFDSAYVTRSDELAAYALPSFTPHRPLLEAVFDLTHRIHKDFHYDPRATTIATPIREVLANRRGVCQDFAHLQIGCLRSLGLSARYVSGYLQTTPPPGQPRLVGADASHAWLAVFCPEFGWVDFDPTNDMIPGQKHITLAWARDYDDVSPIKGVILGGGQHSMSVSVDVQPHSTNGEHLA